MKRTEYSLKLKFYYMSKQLLIYFLTIILFISCKDDKQTSPTTDLNDNKSSAYILILEAKFSLNDKFQIYYTDEEGAELSGENVIDMFVYGNAEMQKIEIPFPEDVIPYKIRFDLGENNSQSVMSIKNISIKYKDKIVDGDNGKFQNYWTPNEALKYDAANFVYNLSLVNGVHDPLMISNSNLEDELADLRPAIKE